MIRNNKNTLLVQYALSGTNPLLEFYYDSEKRIESVRECIKTGYYNKELIKIGNSEDLVMVRLGCNSPLCPHCIEKRKRKSRAKLRLILSRFIQPRFMTLGFKNVQNMDKMKLRECSMQFNLFKKYLKRKKYTLGAYISVLEIKYNKDSGWNIHYHILYDGDYIPRDEAIKIFKQVTQGASWYIDIRLMGRSDRVRSKNKAMNYVTKYLSKMSFIDEDFRIMSEFYESTRRMRFLKIHGIKYKKMEKNNKLYRNYLYDKGFNYLEIEEHISEIQAFLNKFELSKFKLSYSMIENYCLNVSGGEQVRHMEE